MGYNYKAKNLCVVWDFFRQEYRVFGAEQVRIRKLFNLTNEEEKEKFYEWFYDHLINMTDQQKFDFIEERKENRAKLGEQVMNGYSNNGQGGLQNNA
jgi:protein tyrosine/serine phosphatase